MAIGDVLLLPFFRLPYLNSRLFMCWKQQQPDARDHHAGKVGKSFGFVLLFCMVDFSNS